MKYVAQYTICAQVSPDDWETITRTMEVTDDTTIAEIRRWVAGKEKISEDLAHSRHMNRIRISVVDTRTN